MGILNPIIEYVKQLTVNKPTDKNLDINVHLYYCPIVHHNKVPIFLLCMFAILAHERLQPTWPLYASGLVRYLVGSPEDTCSSFRQALQCSRVQLQHGQGYVFEPVCLKSAHDGNFSGGPDFIESTAQRKCQ